AELLREIFDEAGITQREIRKLGHQIQQYRNATPYLVRRIIEILRSKFPDDKEDGYTDDDLEEMISVDVFGGVKPMAQLLNAREFEAQVKKLSAEKDIQGLLDLLKEQLMFNSRTKTVRHFEIHQLKSIRFNLPQSVDRIKRLSQPLEMAVRDDGRLEWDFVFKAIMRAITLKNIEQNLPSNGRLNEWAKQGRRADVLNGLRELTKGPVPGSLRFPRAAWDNLTAPKWNERRTASIPSWLNQIAAYFEERLKTQNPKRFPPEQVRRLLLTTYRVRLHNLSLSSDGNFSLDVSLRSSPRSRRKATPAQRRAISLAFVPLRPEAKSEMRRREAENFVRKILGGFQSGQPLFVIVEAVKNLGDGDFDKLHVFFELHRYDFQFFQPAGNIVKTFTESAKSAVNFFQNYGKFAITRMIRPFGEFLHGDKLTKVTSIVNIFFQDNLFAIKTILNSGGIESPLILSLAKSEMRARRAGTTPPKWLDQDISILDILLREGKAEVNDIAGEILQTDQFVRRRLRHLKNAGLIGSYPAVRTQSVFLGGGSAHQTYDNQLHINIYHLTDEGEKLARELEKEPREMRGQLSEKLQKTSERNKTRNAKASIRSLRRLATLKFLANKSGGAAIKEIRGHVQRYLSGKVAGYYLIVDDMKDMEGARIVEVDKRGRRKFYKLSDKGKDLIEEIDGLSENDAAVEVQRASVEDVQAIKKRWRAAARNGSRARSKMSLARSQARAEMRNVQTAAQRFELSKEFEHRFFNAAEETSNEISELPFKDRAEFFKLLDFAGLLSIKSEFESGKYKDPRLVLIGYRASIFSVPAIVALDRAGEKYLVLVFSNGKKFKGSLEFPDRDQPIGDGKRLADFYPHKKILTIPLEAHLGIDLYQRGESRKIDPFSSFASFASSLMVERENAIKGRNRSEMRNDTADGRLKPVTKRLLAFFDRHPLPFAFVIILMRPLAQIFYKLDIGTVTPIQIVFTRFVLATLVFWIWTRWTDWQTTEKPPAAGIKQKVKNLLHLPYKFYFSEGERSVVEKFGIRQWFYLFASTGLHHIFQIVIMLYAFQALNLYQAYIIASLNIVFAAVLMRIVIKEKTSYTHMVGIALLFVTSFSIIAFIGGAQNMAQVLGALSIGFSQAGVLAAVSATFIYSIIVLFSKLLIKSVKEEEVHERLPRVTIRIGSLIGVLWFGLLPAMVGVLQGTGAAAFLPQGFIQDVIGKGLLGLLVFDPWVWIGGLLLSTNWIMLLHLFKNFEASRFARLEGIVPLAVLFLEVCIFRTIPLPQTWPPYVLAGIAGLGVYLGAKNKVIVRSEVRSDSGEGEEEEIKPIDIRARLVFDISQIKTWRYVIDKPDLEELQRQLFFLFRNGSGEAKKGDINALGIVANVNELLNIQRTFTGFTEPLPSLAWIEVPYEERLKLIPAFLEQLLTDPQTLSFDIYLVQYEHEFKSAVKGGPSRKVSGWMAVIHPNLPPTHPLEILPSESDSPDRLPVFSPALTNSEMRIAALSRAVEAFEEKIRANFEAGWDAWSQYPEFREMESAAQVLQLDMRPIRAGFLGPLYVGYAMEARKKINPRPKKNQIAVYGGSDADISKYLLTINADTGYFVDRWGVSEDDIREALKDWDNIEQHSEAGGVEGIGGYSVRKWMTAKRQNGFGGSGGLYNDNEVPYAKEIVVELKTMGAHSVTVGSVQTDNDKTPYVEFLWSLTGLPQDERLYRIHFVTANLKLPEKYPEILKNLQSKVDFYFQSAAWGLAQDADMYLPAMAFLLKEGGELVTSDYDTPNDKGDFIYLFNPGPHLKEEGISYEDLPPTAGMNDYARELEHFREVFRKDSGIMPSIGVKRYGWWVDRRRVLEKKPMAKPPSRLEGFIRTVNAAFLAARPLAPRDMAYFDREDRAWARMIERLKLSQGNKVLIDSAAESMLLIAQTGADVLVAADPEYWDSVDYVYRSKFNDIRDYSMPKDLVERIRGVFRNSTRLRDEGPFSHAFVLAEGPHEKKWEQIKNVLAAMEAESTLMLGLQRTGDAITDLEKWIALIEQEGYQVERGRYFRIPYSGESSYLYQELRLKRHSEMRARTLATDITTIKQNIETDISEIDRLMHANPNPAHFFNVTNNGDQIAARIRDKEFNYMQNLIQTRYGAVANRRDIPQVKLKERLMEIEIFADHLAMIIAAFVQLQNHELQLLRHSENLLNGEGTVRHYAFPWKGAKYELSILTRWEDSPNTMARFSLFISRPKSPWADRPKRVTSFQLERRSKKRQSVVLLPLSILPLLTEGERKQHNNIPAHEIHQIDSADSFSNFVLALESHLEHRSIAPAATAKTKSELRTDKQKTFDEFLSRMKIGAIFEVTDYEENARETENARELTALVKSGERRTIRFVSENHSIHFEDAYRYTLPISNMQETQWLVYGGLCTNCIADVVENIIMSKLSGPNWGSVNHIVLPLFAMNHVYKRLNGTQYQYANYNQLPELLAEHSTPTMILSGKERLTEISEEIVYFKVGHRPYDRIMIRKDGKIISHIPPARDVPNLARTFILDFFTTFDDMMRDGFKASGIFTTDTLRTVAQSLISSRYHVGDGVTWNGLYTNASDNFWKHQLPIQSIMAWLTGMSSKKIAETNLNSEIENLHLITGRLKLITEHDLIDTLMKDKGLQTAKEKYSRESLFIERTAALILPPVPSPNAKVRAHSELRRAVKGTMDWATEKKIDLNQLGQDFFTAIEALGLPEVQAAVENTVRSEIRKNTIPPQLILNRAIHQSMTIDYLIPGTPETNSFRNALEMAVNFGRLNPKSEMRFIVESETTAKDLRRVRDRLLKKSSATLDLMNRIQIINFKGRQGWSNPDKADLILTNQPERLKRSPAQWAFDTATFANGLSAKHISPDRFLAGGIALLTQEARGIVKTGKRIGRFQDEPSANGSEFFIHAVAVQAASENRTKQAA
ncbi:MAG: DMT family transporter, partial [Candidatus Omnitrophica bacterium]|nr:DMT family transporter [Candidatus Omnitrophota bacterium]